MSDKPDFATTITAAYAAEGDERAGPAAGHGEVHVVGCDGVVAHVWVCGDGDCEGEGDEEDGEEEADGEVVAVRCFGR